MRRIEIYMLLTVSIAAIFTASLVLLGEPRIDAYISLAILSHFISAALTRAETEVDRRMFTALNAVLIAVFAAIAALRVVEILYPGLLKSIIPGAG